MPMLPWLHDLIRLADSRADLADGVLNGDAGDGRIHEGTHEGEGLGLLVEFVLPPAGTAHREVGAWRVGDHHVPAIMQHVEHTTVVVRAGAFGRQQVA